MRSIFNYENGKCKHQTIKFNAVCAMCMYAECTQCHSTYMAQSMLLWSSLLLLFYLYLIFMKMVVCVDYLEHNLFKIHLNATHTHRVIWLFWKMPYSTLSSLSSHTETSPKNVQQRKKEMRTTQHSSRSKDFNICLVFINFDEIVYNNIKFHVDLM